MITAVASSCFVDIGKSTEEKHQIVMVFNTVTVGSAVTPAIIQTFLLHVRTLADCSKISQLTMSST